MTLAVDDVREFVGTNLSEEAVQRLLDSAYGDVYALVGTTDDLTEQIRAGSGPLLMLSQAAAAIVEVTEDVRGASTALDPDDYALRPSGSLLERLDSGPTPSSRWLGLVEVIYTLTISDADRDRVVIELLKLDVSYQPFLSAQSSDSWSESYSPSAFGEGSYADRRAALLASLGRQLVVL
jgi:hypothetical protein